MRDSFDPQVRTKKEARWISRQLDYAEAIHGDRNQSQREAALNAFRRGYVQRAHITLLSHDTRNALRAFAPAVAVLG